MYVDALKMFFAAKMQDPEITGSMTVYIPVREAVDFQVYLEEKHPSTLRRTYTDESTSATFYYLEAKVTFKCEEDHEHYKITIS